MAARPAPDPHKPKDDSNFVRRLRIYPHALREQNAYYAPDKIALLFGYFKASASEPDEHMPGGMVFACLSHDIVAHETTHALLDGMHRSFLSPTNPDVLAFHEAFADIVALFQHFTFPEILRHQISTRGRCERRRICSASSRCSSAAPRTAPARCATPSASKEDGEWKPPKPTRRLRSTLEPHAIGRDSGRGRVRRVPLDLRAPHVAICCGSRPAARACSQPGAIHPDLVKRLANEAAKAAQHVLNMCIRALD